MKFKVMLWLRGKWQLLAEDITDAEARSLKTQAERKKMVASIWRIP